MDRNTLRSCSTVSTSFNLRSPDLDFSTTNNLVFRRVQSPLQCVHHDIQHPLCSTSTVTSEVPYKFAWLLLFSCGVTFWINGSVSEQSFVAELEFLFTIFLLVLISCDFLGSARNMQEAASNFKKHNLLEQQHCFCHSRITYLWGSVCQEQHPPGMAVGMGTCRRMIFVLLHTYLLTEPETHQQRGPA